MPSVVRFTSPHVAEVIEEDLPPLGADEVRLRTLYSGISAGTELTAYRGSNPYLTKKWDSGAPAVRPDGSTSFAYPVDGWGYEEVGEVVEVGADAEDVAVGDRVWGTWGHRPSPSQTAERVQPALLSPVADPRIGIFSQIGAIGLNVILDADIHVGRDRRGLRRSACPARSRPSWPGSTVAG